MESMRVNILADPLHLSSDRLDLNCRVYHSQGFALDSQGNVVSGELIDIPTADRYQPTSGVADIGRPRYFRTPWQFEPGQGIIAITYAMGPPGIRWGIGIHVEGYVL